MNTYPLVRIKWSNEHVMAAVFFVSVLYMLPSFIGQPSKMLEFLAVLLISIIIDTGINFVRFKRLVCAVSSAVTASVFFSLSQSLPLWSRFLGIIIALIAGKHVWGGTGKNPVNPAIFGVFFISLFTRISINTFDISWLLIPAILLSIPFMLFRPYASIGLLIGMLSALIFSGELKPEVILSTGVFFWVCLIITDPVTMTDKPLAGIFGGLIIGFMGLSVSTSISCLSAGLLLLNLLSYIIDTNKRMANPVSMARTKIKKIVSFNNNTSYYNLTYQENEETKETPDIHSLDCDEILSRMEKNDVFGFGGAGFSTVKKIKTVMSSQIDYKYLIVNAVECDPGLIHDHWIIKNFSKEIILGMKILERCISFKSSVLAAKDDEDFRAGADIKTVLVPDNYPAGAEKILIRQILNIRLDYDDIPAEKGILVLNLQTVYAVYEAVIKNNKADTRFITVSDINKKISYIVKVKLGTPIYEIVNKLRFREGDVFAGGGAMQCRLALEDDIITKSINYIAIGAAPRYKESPLCSKCGLCRRNCPSGLLVDKIYAHVKEEEWSQLKDFEPQKCLQCGNCSRVCLAGRNLFISVKKAKEHI